MSHHPLIAEDTQHDAPVSATPRRRSRWNVQMDTPSSLYFADLSNYPVLSAAEEIQQTSRLFALEQERWTIALREPELIEAIHMHLQPLLGLDGPEAAINALKTAAQRRVSSKRPTTGSQCRYDHLVQKTAGQLHAADADRDLIRSTQRVIDAISRDPVLCQQPKWASLIRDSSEIAVCVRSVKHAFIRSNLRLVVSIARRYDRSNMPLIDLIQEGNLGLIKAVERFDCRKGFRFNTYATWWIRHSIGRALTSKGHTVRVPLHALDAQHRIGRAIETISKRLGRTATEQEVALETGLSVRKQQKVQRHQLGGISSLDHEISSGDVRIVLDRIADESAPCPFESTMVSKWIDRMSSTLEVLSPVERTIITWRFGLHNAGEEMTLKEIGRHYNLSRERIRQIQEQALQKLRRQFDRGAA